MQQDGGGIQDLENIRESAEFVADNAFSLLRLNLLIIGIYLTVGGYLTDLSPSLQESIATSYYMPVAGVMLLMSIVVGYITYESAGRLAAVHMYDNPREEYDRYTSTERLIFNLRYGVFLLLVSGLSFGFGIIDGYTPGGIGVLDVSKFVYGLLVISITPIVAAHYGFRIVRRVRDYYQNLRERIVNLRSWNGLQ